MVPARERARGRDAGGDAFSQPRSEETGSVRHKFWRVVLPVFALLALAGSLLRAEPATAANNGYTISQGTGPNNNRPTITVSPDGATACAMWYTFDQSPNVSYLRVYSIATNSWNPPLSSPALAISGGDDTATPRCAIDGAGAIHVVYFAKSQGLKHR